MYNTEEYCPNDDSKVLSQQPALILEEQWSKSAMTPTIDVSIRNSTVVSPLQKE